MLAIIIINYRNESQTIKFINNEIKKIKNNNIVIIVNNESDSSSVNVFEHHLDIELVSDIHAKLNSKLSKYYLIECNTNLGFAKANNLAAEFAHIHFEVKHFLFSNNDICIVDNNVVNGLIDKADSSDEIGLIGPRVIGHDQVPQSPEAYIPFWSKYVWMYWITPFVSIKTKNKLFNIDYPQHALEGSHYKIMGSFFLMKANDFFECGMMDSNTFLYAEEVILSERLAKINKVCYYYPKYTVIHEHGYTVKKFIDAKKAYTLKFNSEVYYYAKYKNVSPLSIVIGKVSMNLYLYLRKTVKQL